MTSKYSPKGIPTNKYALEGIPQKGPYKILPPDREGYEVYNGPGVETRLYPDGGYAIFGPALCVVHIEADYIVERFLPNDAYPELTEPVREARQKALEALLDLMCVCEVASAGMLTPALDLPTPCNGPQVVRQSGADLVEASDRVDPQNEPL